MNIYKRVCVPCIDAALNRNVKPKPCCDVEELWRVHVRIGGVKELCPLGKYAEDCPNYFEHAVAAGMEKDDGSGVGSQLLRLL